MADFLLELRCEEIPARMQPKAKEDLARLFGDALAKAGLQAASLETFATPRRLALIAKDLPLATLAVSEETKGPKVGAPPQALEGFLRKVGLSAEQLVERDGVYFAVVEKPGRDTAEVLAEAIPAIIRAFPWPKSMRWGAGSITTESLRWVRPLSGIIALLDGAVVPCEVDGIASGRSTMGHRFHHSGPVEIADAGTYIETLRAAHVIVHFSERCRIIRDGAAKVAAEAGLTLVADEGLVFENAGLTEWPVPLLGRFDETFLDVPPEVIQLTARVNQKYFVCEDASGKLANAFVCTANIDAIDPAVVVDGNRKVLAARLSDARFFWEQDQKTSLGEHAKKLERITFHEKLGTVADKVERVAKLAEWLASEGIVPNCDPALARQAAELCKADLVTEMVGEFPELQGLMGGYYAAKEGLPQEVSDAIRDHYKPVGQGDDVPHAPVTVAVSLADKLDTLTQFYKIGQVPTGSKDPFALRRAALAIIQLLSGNGLRLPLRQTIGVELIAPLFAKVRVFGENERVVAQSMIAKFRDFMVDPASAELQIRDAEFTELLKEMVPEARRRKAVVEELLDFFADRLKVQQREAGVRHDLIDAVFALGGEDDLVRLLARVHALQAFVSTEDGTNLLAGYKRAANILKKEDWRGIEGEIALTGEEDPLAMVDDPELAPVIAAKMADRHAAASTRSYTPEPAEQALISALETAGPAVRSAIEDEDFDHAMRVLASLREPIDTFFENVTVNDADANKRAARLALLAAFRDAVHRVADFSRIEG
ncbi:glycine--tRNA ligase subunit beta [Porphyrobacter sp. AAP60]|uniref:glycine--tRNA ligase subunit beta n=1 Tax=Porphyrobacter sp. AAP60 TaxID=1523423 RepID=UPI0006B8A13C|nr:glycine--tRNA ligase subunit beta [Porphyrobacter sp. AAP60]KPF65156.1 glycyl-tRNA synthetase subunit beta [Porphyrobacter sp. AAP60]